MKTDGLSCLLGYGRMAPHAEGIKLLRVVCRMDFSRSRCNARKSFFPSFDLTQTQPNQFITHCAASQFSKIFSPPATSLTNNPPVPSRRTWTLTRIPRGRRRGRGRLVRDTRINIVCRVNMGRLMPFVKRREWKAGGLRSDYFDDFS